MEVGSAGPWTLEQLKTFLMTFIKSLNITKGSFTVWCSNVDHGFKDMKTLPLCIFPLNGSLQSFVVQPLERDGFWMMAVHLWKVKMWGQRRTPVCNVPRDFTKLTSYRAASKDTSVFVSASRGVNCIREEPGLQWVALCWSGPCWLCVSAGMCVC